ncbi:MAG: polysaccharide biosynthesis/export family protein [Pirellulales bacterium]|nr:polysaccharide biosynthesis/export family protein [Pirellulales bacterium]
MLFTSREISGLAGLVTLISFLAGSGCQTVQKPPAPAPVAAVPVQACSFTPQELHKTVLPTYVIEPPDILTIDAIRVVPRSPYHLRSLDALSIQVQGTFPDAPISGVYVIEPGGFVQLGPRYGSVHVAGMTLEEAQAAIQRQLLPVLRTPVTFVGLAQVASGQQIAGLHLVGPDGTVTLGSYGSVPVVGMTIAQAKSAIERHLSYYFDHPEVAVDIYAYNSKMYYIVTQGAGLGDGVYRFPVTGNETVLDAIAQINGLQQVSSKKIWIARPTCQPGAVQVLPVKWEEITAEACASTNYQILPGDRVFIAEDKMIALDTSLAKITAPFERIMGFSLLGVGTATRFSGPVLQGGGNPRSSF